MFNRVNGFVVCRWRLTLRLHPKVKVFRLLYKEKSKCVGRRQPSFSHLWKGPVSPWLKCWVVPNYSISINALLENSMSSELNSFCSAMTQLASCWHVNQVKKSMISMNDMAPKYFADIIEPYQPNQILRSFGQLLGLESFKSMHSQYSLFLWSWGDQPLSAHEQTDWICSAIQMSIGYVMFIYIELSDGSGGPSSNSHRTLTWPWLHLRWY